MTETHTAGITKNSQKAGKNMKSTVFILCLCGSHDKFREIWEIRSSRSE